MDVLRLCGTTAAIAVCALLGETCSKSTEPSIGPPAAAVVTVQPGNITAGAAFSPTFTVQIEDANGRTVDAAVPVTITLVPGTGTPGAHVRHASVYNSIGGLTTFPSLSVDSVGSGYRMSVSAPGVPATTTSAFDVAPGPPARPDFTTRELATRATMALSPAVVVVLRDSMGNVATGASDAVTLGVYYRSSDNPVLSGTVSRHASAGVATFDDVSLSPAGWYSLQASDGSLPVGYSAQFAVLSPPGFGGHPTGDGDSAWAIVAPGGPYGVAFSASGAAWVTRYYADSLTEMAPYGPVPIGQVATGNGPVDITFDSTGTRAYVSNYFSRTVSVIDAVAVAQTAAWPVPGSPMRVLLGLGGAKLYVTLDSGTVAVLDATSGAVRKTLTLKAGGTHNGIARTSDGSRLYVSDYRNGTLTEISTAADTVTRSLNMGGQLQEVVVAPGDSLLYVADEAGPIKIVSLGAWAVKDTIPARGVFAMAITPDRTQLWATSGAVKVIDLASLTGVNAIAVMGVPKRIAFSKDGSTAAVANNADRFQVIR